ncbi:hypothetical protein ASPVEDRAFT_81114 [Aspergillus versicolor CBS 583.65]|uniref:Uncharacterized protein n=1 Tax=Aspergillus versicolor CBS 583.65 TaxID=1036611 RepID=A0A1L9PDD6_ASPVE|nr:uncharacterized protein ASPVEDRAFT_81114 [Aspergillus versicolor CBS 583.65]OJI99502.1 hypothetical protein ASPVEDRAFT_81114 [Aspergillus versicolor CBS 583.65]
MDCEKTSVKHIGNIAPETDNIPLSQEEQSKLSRKIDLRLTCVLGCLYLLSQIDKNNLGNANIADMSTDLSRVVLCGFTGSPYALGLNIEPLFPAAVGKRQEAKGQTN